MEEKSLYPMKFCSIRDEYNWGAEDFRLADLGYKDSLVREGWLAGTSLGEIMDMYVDRVVGEDIFEFYGRQFPVCIRNIEVRGRMPLRVNPNDEIAEQRYDFLGKEKLWYISSADKGAQVMLGFRRDSNASELLEKCNDNSVDSILNIIPVQTGQYFYIKSGTPHCASGNLNIIEIAQSSPLDFCLCAWGEKVSEIEFDPSLSIIDALDFINYTAYSVDRSCSNKVTVEKLVDIPQFIVNKLKLSDSLHIYSENFASFIIYSCTAGQASIQVPVHGQTASFNLNKGESILICADSPDFFLVPIDKSTVLLETSLHIEESDPYINPNGPEHLNHDNCEDDCNCGHDDCNCHHHKHN